MKRSNAPALLAIVGCLYFPSRADAVLYIAPTVNGVQAYMSKLAKSHPGLSQVQDKMQHYTVAASQEQVLIPQLSTYPGYAEMAAEKPELQTLTFELAGAENQISVLTSKSFESRKKELVEMVEQYGLAGGFYHHRRYNEEAQLLDKVNARNLEIFEELQGQDPRSFLIGLINSVPQKKKGEYFKLGDPSLQVKALAKEVELTDASIAANFKVAGFKLDKSQITKNALLALIRKNIALEKEVVLGLRLEAYVSKATAGELRGVSERGYYQNLNHLKAEIRNLENAEDLDFADDLSSVRVTERYASQEHQELAAKFLKLKNKNEYEVKKLEGENLKYRIVEQPPFVSIYRSAITGDCSSTHSWAMPYSPMEREYFVYLPTGKLVAHVGATIVFMNGVKTLYVHDVKGNMLSPKVGRYVLHALHASVKQLGAEQISLATAAQTENNGQSPQMDEVLEQHRGPKVFGQVYPDEDIRVHLLGAQVGSSSNTYDPPNQPAHLFVPHKEIMKELRAVNVEFQTDHKYKALAIPGPELTPQQLETALRAALSEKAAKPETLFPRSEAKQAAFHKVLEKFQNLESESLQQFGSQIEKVLKFYKIEEPDHWLSQNRKLLQLGLLRSSEVAYAPAPWRDLWFQVSREALHERDAKALGLILENKESKRIVRLDPDFMAIAAQLRASVPADRAMIMPLVEAGVPLETFVSAKGDKKNPDLLLLQQESSDPLKALEAAEKLIQAKNPEAVTPGALRTLSKLLNNEKAKDLAPSKRAIRLLSHFQIEDHETLKNIVASAKYEEDVEFRFLAASIAAQAGVAHRKIIQALESDDKKTAALPKVLQERGAKALAYLKKNFAADVKKALAKASK